LAFSVLAGYGLKYISKKVKSRKYKVAIPLLCCGLILFEFWFNPLTHYIDLSEYPETYDWLKNQEQVEVIAEYPMPEEGISERYKFYQTIHHKKLINGATPSMESYETKLKILNLGDKETPSILKELGADYIIVHTDFYLKSENLDERRQLEEIRSHPDLKLIKEFPNGIEVYGIEDSH
jgi:hypothetical protein